MVTRINEIKEYVGPEAELPTTLPYGDIYFCSDTDNMYKYNADGLPVLLGGGASQFHQVSVENDTTVGIDVDVTKENTDGSGFLSNVYGARNNARGNSTETVVNINATRSFSEHTGSGQTYYITGASSRGIHNGSGNSTAVYGNFALASVTGTGVGAHEYVVGDFTEGKLDNANATVKYLQGAHIGISLGDGDVTDDASGLLLDLDYTGSGTITGNFDYLTIVNDTLPTISGIARAINCKSVLPSVFGGSIQAEGLVDSGVTEHADNAAAVTAGLAVGTHYRTGDDLKIVH